MTQTSLLEVQTAMVTKLKANTTLTSIVTGVFDWGAVPENQAFPYIAVGDNTEGPDNTFGRRGYEATCTLHIWDGGDSVSGFARCYQILAQMNASLDQQALVLSSQAHVGTWYEFSQTMNDPGANSIRHMPVRYRFNTQE